MFHRSSVRSIIDSIPMKPENFHFAPVPVLNPRRTGYGDIDIISVYKSGRTRINAHCLKTHGIRRFRTVLPLYSPQRDIVGFKFYRKNEPGGGAKLVDQPGSQVASLGRFYRDLGLGSAKLTGVYRVEGRMDAEFGSVLILSEKLK